MPSKMHPYLLVGILVVGTLSCSAQDTGVQGYSRRGDIINYSHERGSYNSNAPNYQQNVYYGDRDSSAASPSSLTVDKVKRSVNDTNGTALMLGGHELQQPFKQQSPKIGFSVDDDSESAVAAYNQLHRHHHLLHQKQQEGLHLGAKVALSILISVVILVASATLVDLNSKIESDHISETLAQKKQKQFTQIFSQQHQLPQARYQRSPSPSSCSSSSLFCSANSFTSASVPILGNHHYNSYNHHYHHHHHHGHHNSHQQDQEQPQLRQTSHLDSTSKNYSGGSRAMLSETDRRKWCNFGRKSKGKNYQTNLQMLFSTPGPLKIESVQCHDVSAEDHRQLQEERIMEAVFKAEHWRRRVAASTTTSNDQQMQHSFEEAKESMNMTSVYETKSSFAYHLLKQIFLAFSLRHSISLIFQTPTNDQQQKQQQQKHQHSEYKVNEISSQQQHYRQVSLLLDHCKLAAGKSSSSSSCVTTHRSRVSSLSSINELSNQDQEDKTNSSSDLEENFCASSSSNQTHHMQQSIDSLHGLRFLSMIWIIVIHSYNFALRWSFFTNTSTLENIYKTAASQLLANGTFACDSFFFAAGFLVPYLVFPAFKAESSQLEKSYQQQQRQQSSQRSTSGTTLSPHTSPASFGSVAGAAATTTTSGLNVPAGDSKYKQDNSLPRSSCSTPDTQLAQEDNLSDSGSSAGNGCEGSSSQLAPVGGHASTCFSLFSSAPHAQIINIISSHQQNQHHGHQTHLTWQQQQQQPYHLQLNQQQQQRTLLNTNEFTFSHVLGNILHRYIRMMPLMMAIIGLSATLLRYLGEGPAWDDSTMMFDKWCRKNWWINALFLHNFIDRENMCLSHSWYSAVDIQLFLLGQLILFALFKSRKIGIFICCTFLLGTQLITGALTLMHHLPAVPLIANYAEQSMNLYYGEIYIKPYCRASPYLIGILLAYLMRTTSLGQVSLKRWQVALGWLSSISILLAILLAMQPAMNGQQPSELQSALYSALSRPLWACATGWMIFACITKHGGIFETILSARCFVPLSRLTYPAFLIHPIVMAVFYGSRQTSFHFSHYLMLYLILGNIVITYASAFILASLFELPLLSVERSIKRALFNRAKQQSHNNTIKSNRTI